MSEGITKQQVVLAGVTTAAMAVAVVGHMYVIDWMGRQLRKIGRSS